LTTQAEWARRKTTKKKGNKKGNSRMTPTGADEQTDCLPARIR
jgi:hypothetical protein